MDEFWLGIIREVPGQYLVTRTSVFVGVGTLPRVLDYFESRRVLLLGMEGIRTDGTGLYPQTGWVIDFSADTDQTLDPITERCADARRFGQEAAREPLFFDVVVDR